VSAPAPAPAPAPASASASTSAPTPAPAPAPPSQPSQPPTSATSKPAGATIIQQQYNDQLTKYRDAHVAYWHSKNVNNLEVPRYEAGFQQGWEDAGHGVSKLEERKAAHITQRGASDLVWEFEHGYNEAGKAYKEVKPAGGAPAIQQQYNEQLTKYRDAHVAYWHSKNVNNLEVYRYEAGFQQGWDDTGHGVSKLEERKTAHITQRGAGDLVWEFEHGYNEAGKAYKEVKPAGGPPAPANVQQQYSEQFAKHRDAHIAYWHARNVQNLQVHRFEAGFQQGWEDCIHGSSKLEERKIAHVSQHGSGEYLWEFDHGYNEAFQAYKRITSPKPTQQHYEQQLETYRLVPSSLYFMTADV
jgi:hypothetical protein